MRRVGILFRDIIERKRAEVEQRQNEERQAFLLKLSDALRPLDDAGEIRATTTRLLGTHLGVDRAMYGEVTGELGRETGVIRGQFIRPAAPGRPAPAPFPDHFTFETFGTEVMARRYSGEGRAVADVNADAGFEPTPAIVFGGSLDMTDAPDLTGRRVLVVEDDYYLAGDTAAALRGAGAAVLGPCPTEDAARDLLEDETPTHAVLDLNLGRGRSPLRDRSSAEGTGHTVRVPDGLRPGRDPRRHGRRPPSAEAVAIPRSRRGRQPTLGSTQNSNVWTRSKPTELGQLAIAAKSARISTEQKASKARFELRGPSRAARQHLGLAGILVEFGLCRHASRKCSMDSSEVATSGESPRI